MMKRTALILVIGVLIGLTACGRNQSTQDNKITEKKEERIETDQEKMVIDLFDGKYVE